jgi:hypothetical protein
VTILKPGGEPTVVELPKTIRVQVTDMHIARGRRGVSDKCAVALALRDMGYKSARVDDDVAWLSADEAMDLPFAVRDWIECFDRGGVVEPFHFELTIQS